MLARTHTNSATNWGLRLRERVFGISPEEATWVRRGFRACEDRVRERLEQVGSTFIEGFNSVLGAVEIAAVHDRLEAIDAERRGFAYEGAGMALAIFDVLAPWRPDRLSLFLSGPASSHVYMVHVGTGWALARLGVVAGWGLGPFRRRVDWFLERLDPLFRWLAVDGFGFHEGYFHWVRSVTSQRVPRTITGYACRAFDQGLGRSLWFVDGANVGAISRTIAAFSPGRQADLWSGVGLACAYAGGVDGEAIVALRQASGAFHPQLAQGVAFAAKARQRAGNEAAATDLACEIICGMPGDSAAEVTDRALVDLPSDGPVPSYELWRQRIQAQWTKEVVRT